MLRETGTGRSKTGAIMCAVAALAVFMGSSGWSPASAQNVDPRYAYNRDFSRVNQIFMNAINQQAPSSPYMGQPAPQPVSPAAWQARPTARPVAPQPVQPAATNAPASQDAYPERRSGKNKGWGWISELRGGALWHSAPISTSTPKERGVDANLEVLFNSPEFMKYILSPRPHVGLSANVTEDTDQIYTGLTWEWNPFSKFIIDFSFGFSLHNGHLHNDAGDEGRFREFGCRVLFRESLELGYRFYDRHLVSVMWDHISHGGICDDENEGMDNLGMRYGYMF